MMTWNALEDETELLPQNGSYQTWKATIETPKVAIKTSHSALLLANVVHLPAILISSTLFYLSFAIVYGVDYGNPYSKTILNGLQFVSKFHEITITTSLTAIVLHRIRYSLMKQSGVPLGFLASAYQLGALDYLVSAEFWGAATAKFRYKISTWLPLWLLVAVSSVLASIVGPSSAILMIPRLDWWPLNNPLNHTSISTFLPLGTSEIWPDVIGPDLLNSPWVLSESEGCAADQAYNDHACPSAGAKDITTWVENYMSRVTAPNITVNDRIGSVSRYLSSSTTNETLGWAVSSIPGLRQARDMGTFAQYLSHMTLQVGKLARPMLIPSYASLSNLKKPIVQAQCSLFKVNDSNIAFPYDMLRGVSSELTGNSPWLIPDSIDITAPSNGVMDFHWVDMAPYTNKSPLLGGVFVSTTPDGLTGIFPCTILSHWTPVSIWLDPMIDSTVRQDSPEPLQILLANVNNKTNKPTSPATLQPINISAPWAETINLPNYFPSLNPTQQLTLLESSAANLGFLHANNSWRLAPAGGEKALPWLLSTILSMHVADGLSRVNSGFATVLYQRDGNNDSTGVLKNLDVVHIGEWVGMPRNSGHLGENYAREARGVNSTHNTEIVWEVKRFGYGWGFENGISIIVGVFVLLLHICMVIVHVGIVAFGGWGVSSCWGSVGELLTLAWRSTGPADGRLGNTSAGIQKMKTWGEVVRVRPTDIQGDTRRLELTCWQGGRVASDGDGVKGDGGIQTVEAGVEYS
ncbi:MAG: hypothetical protein L6R35_002392 [Caloplaca aegaea]|nr:MAG: hypothetical protein L6R35_002392 [Caloplaca aegaea]